MAQVTVALPVPLRRLVGGAAEVRCTGDSVAAIMGSLAAAHPSLGRGLLDADGRPRRFARLYLDDAEVGRLDAPVRDGARLTIVVAMAGG